MKKTIKKIESLKEFIRSTKSSKSTIYRFYKKNEDLFNETKLDGNKRFYPEEHVRYFDSEIMFDENKVLRMENQSMRNLIDCLVDRDSLQSRLWSMDWSFFGTVAYKLERNKKLCFRMMHSLYDELMNNYGDMTEIRIFFVTEQFKNRMGYHNHFTLFISSNKLKEQIINDIQNFFQYDRVDIKVYDKYKAGLFYMAKEGLQCEDWDLVYNNLGEDKMIGYAS